MLSNDLENIEIERHRAAIRRYDLSRPVKLALSSGVLHEGTKFFDYGCGHGEDVEHLKQRKYDASGWDPHYFPQNEFQKADVVNLGYVLNVIEDEYERRDTLWNAWNLARNLLIVAAQVAIGEPGKGSTAYNDGFVTSRNTFQKYFEQNELKRFIDDVLDADSVPVGLGVFFVFRNQSDAEEFRASRYRSRAAYPSKSVKTDKFAEQLPILQPLLDFMLSRGRLPLENEIENASEIRFHFSSIARALANARRFIDDTDWQEVTNSRKADLLVYLALSRFQRRPQFSALPTSLRADIKAFFGTYKHACSLGDGLLFSLGQPETIPAACRKSSVGKFVGNALYVHASALDKLNPILRVYEGCASRTFGQLEETTIVKFRADKPKVSYLYYPEFDCDPHPALHSSMQANLKSLFVDFRDYSASENPPILHRKEVFVDREYLHYGKFARLTKEEEKFGLLNDAHSIGTRLKWEQRLADKSVYIKGHRVRKLSQTNC